MMTVTSSRLPASRPVARTPSMSHAGAAVDRDDGSVDVSGRVTGQPGYRAGHLVRLREAPGRYRGEVPLAQLLGEACSHVGLHEAGGDNVRGDVAGTQFP